MESPEGPTEDCMQVITPDEITADIPICILHLFPALYKPFRNFMDNLMISGLNSDVFPYLSTDIDSVEEDILAKAIQFAELHAAGPMELDEQDALLGDYETVKELVNFYTTVEADALIVQFMIYLCHKDQPLEDISELLASIAL